MKINASINDFSPLLRGPEFLFKGLQATGIDGVELAIGFKSRWSGGRYQALAEKYQLPIASLHQPLWSGLGIYFDEGFFKLAKQYNVDQVVCHPLPRISFKHPRMQRYLARLSEVQKKTGIEILLENLPEKYNHPALNYFFPPNEHSGNIMDLYEAAEKFGLKITLDVDHLQLPAPHKEKWFQTVLPRIGNIHLSSFGDGKRHLPLYRGGFRSVEFMRYLEKARYKGLITFEINDSGPTTLIHYNFGAIQKSVEKLQAS